MDAVVMKNDMNKSFCIATQEKGPEWPKGKHTFIYYIDEGLLLENIPTANFHTKLHPWWRIFHILTSEDITDVISRH